jgi:hypothetical protein
VLASAQMNGIAWVAAIIRLMALWLAVNVLIALPPFIAQWRTRGTYGGDAEALFVAGIVAGGVRLVSTIVIAALLWTTPRALAERIWQPVDDEDMVPLPLADIQLAVFAALGLYLIVIGLPNLVEIAYRYYSLPPRFGFEENFRSQLISGASASAVDIAAGVALFFGARRLTNLTNSLRTPDNESGPDEEATVD